MTPEERAFLEASRVGYLATADAEGHPHVVPICFAFAGEPPDDPGGDPDATPRVVSPIDEKPKSTRDLQRIRDVRANPRVALVVDRYEADWSNLAWVQVRGRAGILDPGDRDHRDGHPGDHDNRDDHDHPEDHDHRDDNPGDHPAAVDRLREKYDQYRDHDLGSRRILSIRVDRVLSWGAVEAGP